jgi:hypothetical protein
MTALRSCAIWTAISMQGRYSRALTSPRSGAPVFARKRSAIGALTSLIDRTEVAKGGIRLSIRVPLQESSELSTSANTVLFLKRHVPLQVRRRGIEMRLVLGGGADPKVDSATLKAVARANRWLAELLSGRSSSLVEIGTREGVGKTLRQSNHSVGLSCTLDHRRDRPWSPAT